MGHTKNPHFTPMGKFQRLLDYLDNIDLDTRQLAAQAGLDADSINRSPPDRTLPTYQYSHLYGVAAQHMQELDITLPWGAGIGTDVFRFMCYSIITCQTLEEALDRAGQYFKLLDTLTGYTISLNREDNSAELRYYIDTEQAKKSFAPHSWDRTPYLDTVAKCSGLKVWYAFLGWLIGRDIELQAVTVAAPFATQDYADSLYQVFQVPVSFDAPFSALRFDAGTLSCKLVHTPTSLDAFLDNAVYSLITQDSRPASTGAAIKSLLAKNGPGTPPTFETMAEDLHMSPSSLRRRLQKEGVSYQELKDQYRCDLAIRYLRDGQLKVQEVAEMLGFMEPSSFIRSFRSWTGVTPKQFRSQATEASTAH